MNKIHLISFGAPFEKYKNAHKRFYNSAKCFNLFNSINIFSEKNIYNFCKDIRQHKNILSTTKGYGYWIWKYYLILEMMNKVEENDIIFYSDLGCTLNKYGTKRFNEHIIKTKKFGVLTFRLEHEEFKYTKIDTYKRVFGDSFAHFSTPQILAGAFFFINNKFNKSIMKEMINIGIKNNFYSISDKPSTIPDHKNFIEHRHDQSLFSLIAKKHNLAYLDDEIFFKNWYSDGIEFPIWATRNRNGLEKSELFAYYYNKFFNIIRKK